MLCLSSCLSLIFLSSTVIHLPLHLLTQLLSPGQGYIVSVHLFPTGLMQTQKTAVNAASRDLSSKELWKPCPDSHPFKTTPICQRQQHDTTTITQPQDSSPEHPPPSMASLAGRNQQLLSHRMPLPAHTALAAASRPPPKTPRWGCSCTAIAAIDNTRHGCCRASTVDSMHTDLLDACAHKEIIHYGSRVGYRRPTVGSLLCHTLWRRLIYFLEAQFIITEMTRRLPDSHAGSEGQVAAI